MGSIPGSGRSPGGGQSRREIRSFHFCLKNPRDRGAWLAIAQRVTKSHDWATKLTRAHTHTHTHTQIREGEWWQPITVLLPRWWQGWYRLKARLALRDPMDYTVHGILHTGIGNLFLLQGTFPTQGLNPGLPHCRQILYQLSHKGSSQGGLLYW